MCMQHYLEKNSEVKFQGCEKCIGKVYLSTFDAIRNNPSISVVYNSKDLFLIRMNVGIR